MLDLQEQMGLTYLFITHNLAVVRHFSDDIAVMYLGQIVERCKANRIFENPLHPYTQALLSAIPIPDPDVKMDRIILEGELSFPIEPPPGCRFAKRCIYAKPECTAKDIPLVLAEEDHYVSCVLVKQMTHDNQDNTINTN